MEDVVQDVTQETVSPETSSEATSTESTDSSVKSVDDIKKLSVGGEKDSTDTAETPTDTVPAAYTPNFKLKVYDKEHEIPEMFRSLMKDAESEKQVREIFEKALGLDGMKPKYQKIKDEYQQAQSYLGEYKKRDEAIGFLTKCIQNRDFDTYFETLNIKEEDLQKWMLAKLEAKTLPPEQQAVYNRQRELQRRAYELEAENQRLSQERQMASQESEQAQTQARTEELDLALVKPEIKHVVEAFDARKGPGAFRAEVIKRGILAWQMDKKDLSVSEALDEVMSLLGPATPQASTTQQSVGAMRSKPTLPIVEGKAVSPTQKRVKSVSDLRKLVSAMSTD